MLSEPNASELEHLARGRVGWIRAKSTLGWRLRVVGDILVVEKDNLDEPCLDDHLGAFVTGKERHVDARARNRGRVLHPKKAHILNIVEQSIPVYHSWSADIIMGAHLIHDGVHFGVADEGVLGLKGIVMGRLLGPRQHVVRASAGEAVVSDA